MHVEISQGWKVNHPLRDDAPVADDNNGLGFQARKLSAKVFVVFDLFRLCDGEPELQSTLFNGRFRQLHPAATRPVGLRDYQTNKETRFDQFLEGWHREKRGSGEDEVEWLRHCTIAPLLS